VCAASRRAAVAVPIRRWVVVGLKRGHLELHDSGNILQYADGRFEENYEILQPRQQTNRPSFNQALPEHVYPKRHFPFGHTKAIAKVSMAFGYSIANYVSQKQLDDG